MDLEQEECDNSGRLCGDGFGKVKGTEEGRCMQEGWEECENGEDVQLGDGHHFCRVEVVPVPEFVCCMSSE
jgi:hypothetical protein